MKINLPRRSAALCLATGLAVATLSACSTGSTGDASGGAADCEPTTEADADAFPVDIETSFGTTTIDEAPTKVVALGVDGDYVVSLGMAPIAIEKMSWGGNDEGRTDWFDDAYADLCGDLDKPELLDTTDGVPVDDIIAMEPDLVLGTNSALTEENYTELTDAGIPTVAYPGVQWTTTWQQSLEMIGQALGRESDATDVQADTEASIQDAADENPQVVGASFIWAYLDPTNLSSVGVYTPGDNRPEILEELGMVSPPVVTDNATDAFYFDFSLENAAQLDADVFITYANSQDEADAALADSLFASIPPIASGNYVISLTPNDTLGLSFPSPLGIPYAMETFVPKIAAAVDGEPQVS